MSPLGDVLLFGRGWVPLPEHAVLTAVAAALLGVSEAQFRGMASAVGLRPGRHNCGRGGLVDTWRLPDLNKLAKRRLSPSDVAGAEATAAERAAGWSPTCPYCGWRSGCSCAAKVASVRADNSVIGDDELMVSLHRKFAANDRNRLESAERENRRRGRKRRAEAQDQADLPARGLGANLDMENQGLGRHLSDKRPKVNGRYAPRSRGPDRKPRMAA
jgi:hypothetical protein